MSGDGDPYPRETRWRAAWRAFRAPGPREPSSLIDRIAARQSSFLIVVIGLALGYILRRQLGEGALADNVWLQPVAEATFAILIGLLWAVLGRHVLVVLAGAGASCAEVGSDTSGWRGVLAAPDIVADDVRAVLSAVAIIVRGAKPSS